MNRLTQSGYQLPDSISKNNVSNLFKEILVLFKEGDLVLDFKDVSEIDDFGIAMISHLKRVDGKLEIVNINPEIEMKLNSMVADIPAGKPETKRPSDHPILAYIGFKISRWAGQVRSYTVLLVDELYHTFHYLLRRRGIFPGEIGNQLFLMGYDSFPIVCLISFLIGVTISITSLEQLKLIGADIFLADLVGFGMIRELVPLMTGIILAGKIGASITAEIASMKVLEEVDALTTMAINPQKYLMVPRLAAITIAIPLLVGMADLVGIIGGVLVGHFFSDIPGNLFFNKIFETVAMEDFLVGLLKTMVFGWVVVFTAGYKGFSVERGAEGVGLATTQSVVMSISLIIILDCLFALVLY